MRKDVQLGFAIGGVLLAVLVVYVLVISGTEPTPDQVTLTTETPAETQTPAPQADPPPPPPTPENSSTPPETTAIPPEESPAPQPRGTTDENDMWSSWLTVGMPATLMKTTTPEPAPAVLPDVAEANSEAIPGGSSSAQLPSSGANRRADPVDPFDTPEPISAGPTTTPSVPQTYTIKSGDTFSSLAQRFYGNAAYYPHIARANPTLNSSNLKLGAAINLPPASQVLPSGQSASAAGSDRTLDATEYRVVSGDNLYKISMKLYNKPDGGQAIYDLNKSTIGADPNNLKIGMILKLPEAPARSGQ